MTHEKLAKGGMQSYLNGLPVSVASSEKRMEYVISIYDITKSSTLMCRISFRKSADGRLWSKFLYINPEYLWLRSTKIFTLDDLKRCNEYLDMELHCHRYNKRMNSNYIVTRESPPGHDTPYYKLRLYDDQKGIESLEKVQKVYTTGRMR